MSFTQPFSPHYGTNQVLTAGAASASVTINRTNKQVRVVNTGTNKAYVRTYNATDGAQSATVADFPIAAGMAATITKAAGGPNGHDTIAYISAAGTTLEVMTGEGW